MSVATACYPIALARPVLRQLSNEKLPTKLETRVLEQAKTPRCRTGISSTNRQFQLYYDFDDAKKKQSRGTEAILNALVLSLDDRFQGRQEPSDDTKKALSILWATQITEGQHKGSWEWLNFGMEPWESKESRYLGAALAAIAVGSAPGNGLRPATKARKERLDSLRDYLKKHFGSQNLHNRVWMLWASASMDGLLTPQEKDQLIEQILAKQLASGGWSLGSLGDFARKDVTTRSRRPMAMPPG